MRLTFLHPASRFLPGLLALVLLPGAPAGAAAKPPARAVAVAPAAAILAAAVDRDVLLVSFPEGRLVARLEGHAGPVNALAFSPDGRFLAAAGGKPGVDGEIRVWDVAARRARVLTGDHTDALYGIAWSPDGKTLAACSYDRLVSLWDVASGQHRLLKDHTDAVYAVAFSPDGRRIASVAGDRTVKIWDVEKGRRLFTLSDATAELFTVAFHPSGNEIAAAGADKMLRKWTLSDTGGTLARASFAHDGPILRVIYHPKGDSVFTAAADRSIKLWDSQTLQERRVFEPQPDWTLDLALSRDGALLAASRYDGSIAVYDAASGARRMEPRLDGQVRGVVRRGAPQ
jgi:WD40 repeat protein